MARLGNDTSDPTNRGSKGKQESTGVTFSREALLREREDKRRAAAARKLAGVGDGADAAARRLGTLNKRATPAQLVASLFAATHGLLDAVPLHKVRVRLLWPPLWRGVE